MNLKNVWAKIYDKLSYNSADSFESIKLMIIGLFFYTIILGIVIFLTLFNVISIKDYLYLLA